MPESAAAAGDISFESKETSHDFDYVCIKVHLHPMHHVVASMLETYLITNGGNSSQPIAAILQNKTTLAINGTLWKNKTNHRAIFVIANGILIIAGKDSKAMLAEPYNFKCVRSITIAHN
jgi:hypothetical protein